MSKITRKDTGEIISVTPDATDIKVPGPGTVVFEVELQPGDKPVILSWVDATKKVVAVPLYGNATLFGGDDKIAGWTIPKVADVPANLLPELVHADGSVQLLTPYDSITDDPWDVYTGPDLGDGTGPAADNYLLFT